MPIVLMLLPVELPPMFHFDWTLNVGNLAVVAVILGVVWKLLPLYRLLLAWQAEHELFLEDYAERHDLTVKEVHGLAMARVKVETRSKARSASA